MLDEEEKDPALSDRKKRMLVRKGFGSSKSEGEYWTLYKEYGDVPRWNWNVTGNVNWTLSAGRDHLEPTEEKAGF